MKGRGQTTLFDGGRDLKQVTFTYKMGVISGWQDQISMHTHCTYVPVLAEAPRHEGIWRSGGKAPLILNLGTRWW
jgi:hypothetical protein